MPNRVDGGTTGLPTTSAQGPAAPVRAARKTATRRPAAPKAAASYTAETWAQALLQRLGAPVTAQNVQAIVSWEAAEGGHWNNTAYFNPLNTTQTAAGATSMNDVGVKAYTSWQQGLDATVKTLKNGQYAGILHALRVGNDAQGVANAVVNSPWGTQQITVGDHTNYGTQSVDTSTRTVSATGATAPSKPLTVKQYLDNPDVQAQYGYLAAYLKDKQIGPILAKAAQQGWGANQLLGALQKTKWWQQTSDSARQWQAQQRLDPASASQRLNQMVGQVQQLAQSTLGSGLSQQRAAQIANTAIGQNWSSAQLQQAVGAEFHYQRGVTYGGQAGQTLDTLRQHADQYLVPISDQSLQKWTQGVLQGTYKDTDFDAYLKQQALSLYPTLKAALDSGVTTRQFLDPYAQMVQQTLGKNPEDLNWMDPKWSKALNTTTPDGQRAPMSLSDWGTYLRSTPDYQTTDQAKQNASDLALHIAQQFGRVA